MDLTQLDALCSDLAFTAKRLRALCSSTHITATANGSEPTNNLLVPSDDAQNLEHEITAAQNSLCGISSRLETLLVGPSSFIRSMAMQASRIFPGENPPPVCLVWVPTC
ncbi:hypothetical protein ACJBU6_02283 [Exserohilum turcicum]